MKRRFGLLGGRLVHSHSPMLHGLLADYEYRLYEKKPEELDGFLRSGDFDGLNVTIPYKQAVIPYLAEISPQARRIGSVNTIVRRQGGALYGLWIKPESVRSGQNQWRLYHRVRFVLFSY